MPYSEKGESTPEVLRGEPEGEHAKRRLDARVDESGHLILPDEVARRLGVVPGASIHILDKRGRFEILPNIHALARVYIEPTTRCNLACQTCIRNTWNEPLGDMDPDVFDALVMQWRRFDRIESLMFGGFGEPTAHKGIVQMR